MNIIKIYKIDFFMLKSRLRNLQVEWEELGHDGDILDVEIYANESKMAIIKNYLSNNASLPWKEIA